MNSRATVLKGSSLLTLGEVVGYGAAFIRNMILARILGKTDFGIAATFAMVMMLLEFTGKLGIAQFLVSDKEGDHPDFISAAHSLNGIAGLFSAGLILILSPFLSRMFGIGESWAIAWLALVVVIRAMEHLDVRRFERDLRFGPGILVESFPQVLVTLAAWPVALWLGDFRTVLFLLVTKAIISCGLSHILAERPYTWLWNRTYLDRMVSFGWPLIVNGFLILGVMQGDQFLVAGFYKMEDLAPFAAAAALVMAPSFVFLKVFSSVALPLLARAQSDQTALRKRYQQVVTGVTIYSATTSVGLIVGAEAILQLIYGPKYSGAGSLLGWLAASNGFRILRAAPVIAAIARGDSKNQMICNFWRLGSLIPAIWLALNQMPIWMLASVGLFGESLACLVSFRRLERRDGVPLSTNLLPFGWMVLSIAFAGALVWTGIWTLPWHWTLLFASMTAFVCGFVSTIVLPGFRASLFEFISKRLPGILSQTQWMRLAAGRVEHWFRQ